MAVISFSGGRISVDKLTRNSRKLSTDMIDKAKETYSCEIAPEHSAEPIKNMDDIIKISKYLIDHGKYRDNMLFIVGINFGLRASDLRQLRFSNLINENLTFKDSFPVFEQKTRNTRKRKKNRYITINNAVMDAVTLYLKNTDNVSLSDYMFKSEAINSDGRNSPITVRSINRLMKSIADDCDINIRMSTHTLRKTFCYWMMVYGNNDQRRLLLLQKMLNHSSPAQTLEYIGITGEEIESAYRELNLGSAESAGLIDSYFEETEAV